jgi:hypothetical protein
VGPDPKQWLARILRSEVLDSGDPVRWAEQVLAWAPSRAYDNRVFVLAVNHAGSVRDEENGCDPALGDAQGIHHGPGFAFSVVPDGRLLAESTRRHNDERIAQYIQPTTLWAYFLYKRTILPSIDKSLPLPDVSVNVFALVPFISQRATQWPSNRSSILLGLS